MGTGKKKKYVLAFFLLIYPLRHCMSGLDLMDAGYSLGNYRFFDSMNETWKIATFLSNIVGMVLMHLPYGDTWIGMNVYTGILVGMVSAVTYIVMVGLQPTDSKKEHMLFITEVVALSLCWAPSTILYHYLGYILMTVASLVLYYAIIKDSKGKYIISGVILGLCVSVRMPNITYIAFIVTLWYYCFANRKGDKKWFSKLVNRTFCCMGGYLLGLLVPIAYIEIRYGLSAYPDMVRSLFGMTENATDYKPTSMVSEIFGEYFTYGIWLILFAAYIAVGILFFKLLEKITKNNKITCVLKILYGLGFLVVLRFCYGRGMFGIDFSDNFSVYKWIVVYILYVILMCLWTVASRQTDMELKLWSVFLLVTIFITPLGSNNGLYPIINNLFVVAPVSVMLIEEFFIKCVDYLKSKEYAFVIKTIITCVMICVFVFSLLYGINFVFHDYPEGDDKRVSVSLKCSDTANGIMTTQYKSDCIEGLDGYIYDNGLGDMSIIPYGDIPAVSYILDMEPAIFTTWVRLDSNSLEKLEYDLKDIAMSDTSDYPLIVVGVEYVSDLLDQGNDMASSSHSQLEYMKYQVMEDFMDENGYELVYENGMYRLYRIIQLSKQS